MSTDYGKRRLRDLADPLVVPGALAVAVFVLFAADDAGYPQTVWYPGALFLVALAAVALPPLWTPPSRAVAVAAACLAAFTLWSFASIAWSDVRGDAWDGANRTLLYLAVFVLFAFLPWRAGSVATLLGVWSVAVAALGAVFLARSVDANPEAYFLLGRLAEPAGYQNANCALFLMAFFPAVFVAARPEMPVGFRALGLAAAAVLLELALLTQSRASVAALPVTLAIFLALVPARARTVVFLVPPVVATALASNRLLDVFPAIREDEGVADALGAAWGALWITAVAV
ncbi:MAG: hypothetical protein M3321_09155, partial [Actinomycetota bacterium]|nr:hypothetical protein [Actinomycetota bacterium]